MMPASEADSHTCAPHCQASKMEAIMEQRLFIGAFHGAPGQPFLLVKSKGVNTNLAPDPHLHLDLSLNPNQ